MELNYIIKNNEKNNSKKAKDSLYKYSISNTSNYHKKTKTETNLYEENPRIKNKITIKSMNTQNSKNSFLPENSPKKIIKKINSVNPLSTCSYLSEDIFIKAKNANKKNNDNNNNIHNQPHDQALSLRCNNINYINYISKKRNTFNYEDKYFPIEKNKSFSNLQHLKENHSLEYTKSNNINNMNNISIQHVSVKNNAKNEYLDLNKIINNENKMNKLNSSKSAYNFLKEDPIISAKLNKYNGMKKFNDYVFENGETKNSSINFSYRTVNNGLLIPENKNNNNLHKFKSFNKSISSSMTGKKNNNKKTAVFGQYYIDIDLSLNSNLSKDNKYINNNDIINKDNKQLLKKSVNLDKSIKSEFKINTYVYNSPIEKNKKPNSKNIIDLRNTNYSNYLNKKYNFSSREKLPNLLNQKSKKIEIKNKKTTKSRLIPYSGNKIKHINDIQNQYLSNSIKKKNNHNITGPKLKKSNNNVSKKDIFYNYDPKIWKDYNISSQKNIKNFSQTPNNKLEWHEYDLNYNTEHIPMNFINLESNFLTDNRLKKNNNSANLDFSGNSLNTNTNSNNNNNIKNVNKKNIFSQPKIDLTKKEKYDEYNSLESDEPKISILYTNKKNINETIKKKKSNSKIVNLSEYKITHESSNNNDIKSTKKKCINNNVKDINLLESVNNLENNNYLFLNINNLGNKSSKNITHAKFNGIQNIINTDSGKKKMSISPNNTCKFNTFNINGNKKNNNNININIEEYNSKNILNHTSKSILNKTGNRIINYTEYNNELLKSQNKNNNKNNTNNKDSHLLLKSISFYKKINNNPVKLNPKKRDLRINKPFNIPSNVRRIYIPNQNISNKYSKINNTVEIKDNIRSNNSISSYYKKCKNNNNIININNNTSNVNVLNVKNSSINIHFEKKEKYKDLSPEKNMNYSTTVNSIHRNNKINVKNIGNDLLEKNKNPKNNTKIKPTINQENFPTYIRISKNTIKNNNQNNNRNDNRLYTNTKKGIYNSKGNHQQLTMNNSETRLIKSIKINKELSDNKNIKINLNNYKDNIDVNIKRLNLNTARSNETYINENNSKTIKIPIKESNNKSNYRKIILPLISANNSIIQNKKISYGIYIKPTCLLSRSKSKKNKSQSEAKSNMDFIHKKRNIISTNKKSKKASKSLNNDIHINTPPYIDSIQNKLNWSLKVTSSLKTYKSARIMFDSSIENINTIKKNRKKLDFDGLTERSVNNNKIMNNFPKHYCFFNKFFNYFLKQPKIDKCYFGKKYIKKHLNKEQTLILNILNKDNKDQINNNINNNNNNKTFNLSIEHSNKDELLINNDNYKNTLSNKKINNEEEKNNESSQNGLIMTFGEVNYNKKNSTIKNNDIITQINNDINDESLKSDIDIYKKLNIIQPESRNKLDDNISENEDIQFYFSDEEGGTVSNFPNPLYNSNKINNNEIYPFESTNGKEISEIDRKICKTFKKTKNGMKYNLEKAEKGLRILKKIAVRRGYKSDDENYNKKVIKKNFDDDINRNRYNIYLGTNKINELFNSRKESKTSFNKKNNSSSIIITCRNKCSKSVNKDIVKGISKIENLFEKKYLNSKNSTYERKYRDNDYSDDNSCNIDNILDYDDELKPKIRTYVQKGKNNLYFSCSKTGKESTNINDNNTKDDINLYMYDNHTNYFINEENNLDLVNHNILSHQKSKEEKLIIHDNEISNNKELNEEELINNNNSIKENLLNEFKKDIINNIFEKDCSNNKLDNLIISNINGQNIKKDKINNSNNNNGNNTNNNNHSHNQHLENKEQKNNTEPIIPINYLQMIKEYQCNNLIKHDIIFLLNICTKENYQNILNQLTDIILYQNINKDNGSNILNKDLNDNEKIVKNEHTFKDIIFNKATTEMIYSSLYSKICNDLNNNISNALIEQKNVKNNKERSLKFILNEECIIYMNKYKKISKDFNIKNKESNDYFLLRKKIIGYSNFVYELINLELIKQQFGFYILEQFYRKYIDKEVNDLLKDLYLEACIMLLNKLGKNIYEKNNKKLIQNINNYINKNLSPLINKNKDNDDNNNNMPGVLKYKIINVIKKNENSWKESLFEIFQKDKNNPMFVLIDDKQEKEIKENNNNSNKEIISNNKNNNHKQNLRIINVKKETKPKIDYKVIIEEDLKNYISYFTELGSNGQISIKNNVDKSYNWKVIDELVNEKNYGLEYIINQFIHICSNTIHDDNQLLISNDYIKNIIEYYSNNLSKMCLDLINNEMIKTFLNIDDIIKNNYFMSKILGNLLFILIENRLYHIKNFNNYLKAEIQTQINLAIITKYCIISAGKFAKKYFNDFKQTKLFFNNNVFKQYVNDALKDLFYFIK